MLNLTKYKNIVILTGAGVSQASGLRTYRGQNGVWEENKVAEYGTIDAFNQTPNKTWELFGGFRPAIYAAYPNEAHKALARFEANLLPHQTMLLATQNVDGLHQRAGSRNVVELHGNVSITRCSNHECKSIPFVDTKTYNEAPKCAVCGGTCRPDITLFGEQAKLDAGWVAKKALRVVDLFIAIGTSGSVGVLYNFVRAAEYNGARNIFINLEALQDPHPAFKETYLGKAELLLPELLNGDNG